MNSPNEFQMTKHAVCFLLVSKSGQVLGITRKDDHTQWGLPGGKVEPNESLAVAVVREMFEETGIVVAEPQSVYSAMVPGRSNFMCTTFIGQVVSQTSDAPRSDPPEGKVSWVDPAVLTMGVYAKYNRALFDHVNLNYGGGDNPSVRAYVGQTDKPPDPNWGKNT